MLRLPTVGLQLGAKGHLQCQALMNLLLPAREGLCEGRGEDCELLEGHCKSLSKAESSKHSGHVGDMMSICKDRLLHAPISA